MKKLISALAAVIIVMSPIGSLVLNDHGHTVDARGYKSGRKSFNTNYNRINKTPAIQKKQQNNHSYNKSNSSTNKSKSTTNQKRGFFSGGLMRGLFIGGLAGLLFGGLFAHMGALGSLLGFVINVFAIILVYKIIRSIIIAMRMKNRKDDAHSWRGY